MTNKTDDVLRCAAAIAAVQSPPVGDLLRTLGFGFEADLVDDLVRASKRPGVEKPKLVISNHVRRARPKAKYEAMQKEECHA